MRVRQIGLRRRPRRRRGRVIRNLWSALHGFLSLVWLPAVLLIAALIWGSPNVRWSYSYFESPGAAAADDGRIYSRCTYLGIDGHRTVNGSRCPLIALFPLRLPTILEPWR